jgi:hypothetical protein
VSADTFRETDTDNWGVISVTEFALFFSLYLLAGRREEGGYFLLLAWRPEAGVLDERYSAKPASSAE